MISQSYLLANGVELIGTLITFFCAYLLVQRLDKRRKLKELQQKKLEPSVLNEDTTEAPKKQTKPVGTDSWQAPKIEQSDSQDRELPKLVKKETKAKKDKKEKNATAASNTKAPKEKQAVEEKPQLDEHVEESTDFGFHQVMPSKKAAREEARRRAKVKDSEPKPEPEVKIPEQAPAKAKPHCPPPSFTPAKPQEPDTQNDKPHCPPPSFAPVMLTRVDESQKDIVKQEIIAPRPPGLDSPKHSTQIDKDAAKEPEATKPTSVKPQKLSTPIDKEILNLEKKVREIEKLKETKNAGGTLEKKQEEKIERAGEIGLKLSQLYAAKFMEEQKNMVVVAEEEPEQEPGDQLPTPQAPKKKRTSKKVAKNSHIPVVVPPRVPMQVPTQPQMWATEDLIQAQLEIQAQLGMRIPAQANGWAPEEEVEEGEDEDFEMTPLDVPAGWGCYEPRDLTPQFDAAPWCPSEVEPAAESEDFICEVAGGHSKKPKENECWDWVTKGMCPRGEFCRWNHRPLGNGAPETSVFALKFGSDSDSDSDSEE
jgi:hypothetical protein